MINDPKGHLQNMLVQGINVLREPAGKKYSSMADIRSNPDQFVKDFHRGLFGLHTLTIFAIIDAEDNMISSGKTISREIKASEKGWKYVRQIFRCINDSIAWTALGPQPSLFIHRTCRNQPRGKLRDQNYESIMAAMQQLLGKGEVLPIWNDATRCLDISDITLLSPHGPTFVEVKTGKVNEEILAMVNKTDANEIQGDLDAFFEKYGHKGKEQIERVIRQEDRANKLVALANNDKVYDPFIGEERTAVDPLEPLKRYDSELTPLFEELRSRDFVSHSVDGCLHILGLNRQRSSSLEKMKNLVQQHLQNKMSQPGPDEMDCRDVIMSLDSSFDYPTSMPVMLRPWASEDIARISLGHMEVYFGFDVNAWARNFQSCRLVWSSERVGKKELNKSPEKRLFMVHNRIPQIINPKGSSLFLGTRFLQIMLSEGISPKSLAAFYDQALPWR